MYIYKNYARRDHAQAHITCFSSRQDLMHTYIPKTGLSKKKKPNTVLMDLT